MPDAMLRCGPIVLALPSLLWSDPGIWEQRIFAREDEWPLLVNLCFPEVRTLSWRIPQSENHKDPEMHNPTFFNAPHGKQELCPVFPSSFDVSFG